MSAYVAQFIKQGDIKNMSDINEIYNINLRHQPKTYTTPFIEKIKKTKQPYNYDYLYQVPKTFEKVFLKIYFKIYFL